MTELLAYVLNDKLAYLASVRAQVKLLCLFYKKKNGTLSLLHFSRLFFSSRKYLVLFRVLVVYTCSLAVTVKRFGYIGRMVCLWFESWAEHALMNLKMPQHISMLDTVKKKYCLPKRECCASNICSHLLLKAYAPRTL